MVANITVMHVEMAGTAWLFINNCEKQVHTFNIRRKALLKQPEDLWF
jgi:hypothetical protein